VSRNAERSTNFSSSNSQTSSSIFSPLNTRKYSPSTIDYTPPRFSDSTLLIQTYFKPIFSQNLSFYFQAVIPLVSLVLSCINNITSKKNNLVNAKKLSEVRIVTRVGIIFHSFLTMFLIS
jgi:hypothetical protein